MTCGNLQHFSFSRRWCSRKLCATRKEAEGVLEAIAISSTNVVWYHLLFRSDLSFYAADGGYN